MKIEFPALNYTYDNWDEIMHEVIIYDSYYYRYNFDSFDKFYLNQTVVDSNGTVWKIIGIKRPKNILRKIFMFLPNVYKCEIKFIKSDEKLSFSKVKEYYLNKVILALGYEQNDWVNKIKYSYNFRELFRD